MKQFFLIMVGISIGLHAELSRSNGIVQDNITRLQWQDDYSDNGNTIKSGNWEEALLYCSNLSLAGGGWRLPNIRELLSIVDYKVIKPSISNVFRRTASESSAISPFYWSSTTVPNPKFPSFAFSVNFSYGTQDYDGEKQLNSNFYVRCVRSL